MVVVLLLAAAAAAGARTKVIVLHKHLSFHGGTTLCNVAKKQPHRVVVPGAVGTAANTSACMLRLFQRNTGDAHWVHESRHYNFVMFESDYASDFFPFPRLRTSPVRFSTVVRHPMPLCAKVCGDPHHRNKYSLNFGMRAFLPRTHCRHCSSKQLMTALPIAKEHLRQFDVVMILDYFQETARMLCVLFGWETCSVDVSKSKLSRYDHPRNPEALARSLFLSKNCTDFDGLLLENKPSLLLFDFAKTLAIQQLQALGLDPGFD